jgi:glycosyltransferase involved in cell wall biosynthesis
MAARYRWLYPRAIAAARRTGETGAGLWLITNNFSTGGAQTSARRLLLGLQLHGERVRAAVIEEDPAFPTPGRRALLERGVSVIAPPLDATGRHEAAIEEILAAIDTDPAQAVLFWNLRPAFKVALADALLKTPVFDVSPGEMFYDSFEKYFQKPNWRFGCSTPREYGALLAGVIVKYFAESERAAAYLGAPVHVVPNGVPIAEADSGTARNGNGTENPAFVFGTAARINPQKRLEDLLEAFRLAHDRLPPYVLRIGGGIERGCNDYASALRAGANGLPIEWLGEVTDVAAFHHQLDAFAMISEPAGCPNASLEAIAAGLPVIATDFGGASEQVIDGVTGRLVPARNPEALAAALVEFATQPDLRRKLSLAGNQLIRQRFSLERMIADYRRICLPTVT